MGKRTILRLGVVAATTVATAATAATGFASAGASAVPHTQPAWTAHAKSLGAASSGAAVSGRLYLSPRGGLTHLAKVATAMATRGSSTYHKFLSAKQFNAKFAPTSADVHAVAKFLRSNGLTVSSVGAANRYVAFSGTASAANRAFGTKITRYVHNGQDVQAPASALKVPASLASTVLAISGLDTTPQIVKPASGHPSPPPGGFRNARPCSLYYGQVLAKYKADFTTPLPKFMGQTLPYAPCGYTGPQFRAAYEGNTSLDGSGVTVAITDAYASGTIASDANRYAEAHGDGSYAPGQFTQTLSSGYVSKKICNPPGWTGEETLDVEAVHAMAPGANIHYYGARSCFDRDLLDTLAQVVEDGEASVVTNSWGDVEEAESADGVAAYEAVFLQGAVEGMSFMFSSGDNGDEVANTGIKQADYPTSDPYVTSVGGTSTAIGSRGQLSWATGWGTVKYSLSSDGNSWNPVGFLYGAGGGASHLFNRPAYQDGTVPGAYRQVPDMAMDADPNTGMLIGQTQAFPEGRHYDEYRIGGTSLASPLFAGMTALAIQNNGGQGVGLLNPAIYNNQDAFTDVTGPGPDKGVVRADFANGLDPSAGVIYSVRTFNQDSSLTTHPGWDDVTGLGSPNPNWLTALGGGT